MWGVRVGQGRKAWTLDRGRLTATCTDGATQDPAPAGGWTDTNRGHTVNHPRKGVQGMRVARWGLGTPGGAAPPHMLGTEGPLARGSPRDKAHTELVMAALLSRGFLRPRRP